MIGKPSVLDRKRFGVWHHALRDRWVANAAKSWLSLVSVTASGRDPEVVVLVESPDHATAMQQRLPWHRFTPRRSAMARRRSIPSALSLRGAGGVICTFETLDDVHVPSAEVIVRADAGVGDAPIPEEIKPRGKLIWLVRQTHPEN